MGSAAETAFPSNNKRNTMLNIPNVEFNVSNLEKDLNKIFDCEEKIKSLTSALDAIKAQRSLLEEIMTQIQTIHSQRS